MNKLHRIIVRLFGSVFYVSGNSSNLQFKTKLASSCMIMAAVFFQQSLFEGEE